MILNGRLTLAVRGTEMWDDFKSWPSINHKWHKPKFTSKEQRLKIDVQDFKNSAEIKSQTKELSSSQRNYIDLTVGLYSSNSSILPIIPFFDSQPVITNPPAPIDEVINHPRPITNNDSNREKILESFNKIYKWCKNFDDSTINHLGDVFKSQINWYDQAESLKSKLTNSDAKKEKEDAIFFDIFELIETKFHNQFMDYLMDYDGCNPDTIDRFIGNIIDNKNYQDMIDLINNFITLTSGSNTFLTCDDTPAYEQFYNLYERVLATTSKAYTMLICTFKFRQLRLSNFNLFEREQHITLENFKSSLKEITKSAKYYLGTIDNPIYKSYKNCDPESWKEGEHYIRVKNYVAYYDPSITWDVNRGMTFEYNYSKEKFCPKVNRDYVLPVHNKMSSSCIENKDNKLQKLCACGLSSDIWDSVNTLSLRQFLVDTTKDQFVVKNGIITLEIRQGTMVNGAVDQRTVFWNTSFGFADEPPDVVRLNYHVKTINLDTIELPEGQFVTGIKFEVLTDNHITLVIRGSEMYRDDKVFTSIHDEWHYPPAENPENTRHNFKLEDFKNPAESSLKNNELSRSGQNYVRLTGGVYSRLFNNFAVIPFIDSRAVVSSPPAPLGGLGLFYKGQPGYGGFIALKYILSKYNLNVDERILSIN
ncbi:Protein of unknown function [Cotesia congregata]|uniref:Uncharacterized protein n=1 Tax=Cotesia congregata TaxID=51543 RepID=A0A8J2MC76_COTCN|nr:Protein of unknown function [Cotesia congregata]